MKPMHIAMALLSAAMFFVLAGVFMGVQLELDGTKLVVDTASDVRWQWVFIGTAVVFFFQLLRPAFQKGLKSVSGPKFILPAIDGSTVKQKLFLVALLVLAVAWPFMVSRGTVDIATLTMIYIILGLGLNVVVGLSGLLVLGYGGFYAIGAYTFALLNHYYGLGFWTCLPIACSITPKLPAARTESVRSRNRHSSDSSSAVPLVKAAGTRSVISLA